MIKHPPRGFSNVPYEYHQEIELWIESLHSERGYGVGYHAGQEIRVAFTTPGDHVRVRIYANRSEYSEADLLQILQPSKDRVAPPCSVFGECAGCQYQHINYVVQLHWIKHFIQERFAPLAIPNFKIENPKGSPIQYGYRSKITPHFQKVNSGFPQTIGFQHWKRRQTIDVSQCPIATSAINAQLPIERKNVQSGKKRFKKGGTLLLRETSDGVITDMKQMTQQQVGKYRFEFKAGEFFQNNPFLLPDLLKYSVEQAKEGGQTYLVDAYCGVGTFSLFASPYFEEVLGVEINQEAVVSAKKNADRNHCQNCSFLAGKAESLFGEIHFDPEQTSMIIDPPRKGCDPCFLEQLFAFAPQRVVYVSCNPMTQAENIKEFLHHQYHVLKIQPFDLFPHSRHIENVVTLERIH